MWAWREDAARKTVLNGGKILQLILRRKDVKVFLGFIWLKIGISSGQLCGQQWDFGFHVGPGEMNDISWWTSVNRGDGCIELRTLGLRITALNLYRSRAVAGDWRWRGVSTVRVGLPCVVPVSCQGDQQSNRFWHFVRATNCWLRCLSLVVAHQHKSVFVHDVLRFDVKLCIAIYFNPLQPSGHYMYRHFNIQQFYVLPTQCFVWIWEQTAIISLYSIKWLVFITEI